MAKEGGTGNWQSARGEAISRAKKHIARSLFGETAGPDAGVAAKTVENSQCPELKCRGRTFPRAFLAPASVGTGTGRTKPENVKAGKELRAPLSPEFGASCTSYL